MAAAVPSASAGVKSLTAAVDSSISAPMLSLLPKLEEFRKDQTSWLTKMEEENARLDDLQKSLEQLELLFGKVPDYLNKVTLLQRDMIMLENKAAELKARADGLRQHKLKELEKEAALQAKPAAQLLGEQNS